MLPITANDLYLIIIGSLYLLGVLCMFLGILILLSQAFRKDVDTIALQTKRLAQKGLAEDVAGLIGNASSLIEATSQLVQKKNGIGLFLIGFGLINIIVAGILTLQIMPG
ncbi:MAG: hypothetical protein PHS96_03640 [Anaerolineales bacterium]|nr:hypothetical protein [Anaerolineales bacterium]MDD5466877.1 hypothetical protein [Anaerolineales bacterium]